MEKENKPLAEESIIEEFDIFICKWCGSMAGHLLDDDGNDGEEFREKLRDILSKHKQAVKEAYEDIDKVLPLKCIRNEKDPDNCWCIACVRDTMRREFKEIFKDKFGFELE